LASAACPEEMSESPPTDAMSESPPMEEEKKESPKSFEFQPTRDPSAKRGLPHDIMSFDRCMVHYIAVSS
jgi:hypothetical protein